MITFVLSSSGSFESERKFERRIIHCFMLDLYGLSGVVVSCDRHPKFEIGTTTILMLGCWYRESPTAQTGEPAKVITRGHP
jgi:hypothetical protein